MRTLLWMALLIWSPMAPAQGPELYRLERSRVAFVSDAPLERIEAALSTATGVLDPGERSFAVQIPMREFQGFNSPLQREHFNENYIESDEFPTARFVGRIIESVDVRRPGTYDIRTKGKFTLHGVTRERIIDCSLVVSEDGIRATSSFEVPLSDHDIRIPRIVEQKIAPVVQVTIDLLFRKAAAR
ncbi:MAG: YceI family protein [Flavobacteriales bacterium]|nr:YceI family protein [Flavobacteriales bacterium]MCB9168507.1 YceI family protein [Flavobacteriales bacterium]